ncbi:lysylphosphatidylglycerol synthase transmembrane domain-containing protein [Aquisalimonas sp.]|uniref:lysylphosphatidylglycerol synthase transmembrane domain-containing protein n=1 Tax=Aquisalimonas sp. TaxID=1872621 RepID=UPI0025B96D03|nr:lysylphosphatidylglycerol synthase transmembrane domain-containing protein [Aquisalimonas sp.]
MGALSRGESKTVRGIFWLTLRVLASVILLGLVLHFAGADRIVALITELNGLYLLPAIPLVLAFKWFAALRLKLLVSHLGMTFTTWQVNRINFISAFYSLMLPGYMAGGAVRWYMLSRVNQMPAQALASIVYDRLGDTIALLGLGLFAYVLILPPESGAARLTLSMVLFGLVVGYVLCANVHVIALIKRWMPLSNGRIGASLIKLMSAFQSFADLRLVEHFWLWFWAIASNLLNGLLVFCVAQSLGLPLTYLDTLWVAALWILAGMLPISISGLGVREGATIVMLLPLGVETAEAVGFSLLLLVSRDVVLAGIGGIFLATTRGAQRAEA